MKQLDVYNWENVYQDLNENGYSILDKALSPLECASLKGLYDDHSLFRKTINMARYRFGSGEYRYFDHPLPSLIQQLRRECYDQLVPLANQWMSTMKIDQSYPRDHERFIDQCADHGQLRPTPLILKYQKGDYNTLHQDLYGEVYFPFQVIAMLSEAGKDYNGGHLVLTEQVPRAQSKPMVLTAAQGDLVIISTRYRPQKGSRGYYRCNLKHGVNKVSEGTRYTLGVIFHNAK